MTGWFFFCCCCSCSCFLLHTPTASRHRRDLDHGRICSIVHRNVCVPLPWACSDSHTLPTHSFTPHSQRNDGQWMVEWQQTTTAPSLLRSTHSTSSVLNWLLNISFSTGYVAPRPLSLSCTPVCLLPVLIDCCACLNIDTAGIPESEAGGVA